MRTNKKNVRREQNKEKMVKGVVHLKGGAACTSDFKGQAQVINRALEWMTRAYDAATLTMPVIVPHGFFYTVMEICPYFF